ncbi:hypothetical protein ABIC60_001329 [Phyllobacterium ifriqiyense]
MEKRVIHKVLLCTICFVLFFSFGWSVLYVRHFVNNAMEGKGHVTNLVKSHSTKSNVYKPVVEFQTVEGATVEFTSWLGTSPPRFSVGESVSVYYDPRNPQSAIINDWLSLWGGSAILGGLTMIFAVIAYMMYFRVSFAKPRKQHNSAKV